MDTRKFNALKWFLIALPIVWGVLAFVAWHEVAQCGHMFGPHCSAVYRDGIVRFTSLSWVWEYQTLVAGVLALGGGAFALKAAKFSSDHQIRNNEMQRAAELTQAYSVVAGEFAVAAIKLDSSTNHEARGPINKDLLFPRTDQFMLEIYKDNPILGTHIFGIEMRVIEELTSVAAANAALSAKCYALSYVLITELKENLKKRNLHVNNLDFEPVSFLVDKLRDLGISVNDLGTIAEFIDWEA